MRLEESKKEILKMFKKSKDNPLRYYSNNLALENNLVDTISLCKQNLVSRTTDEKTNRAYFTISKKGLDYLNTIAN